MPAPFGNVENAGAERADKNLVAVRPKVDPGPVTLIRCRRNRWHSRSAPTALVTVPAIRDAQSARAGITDKEIGAVRQSRVGTGHQPPSPVEPAP